MANLALRLQVFLSSPSDVQEERDAIERIIVEKARDVSRHDLLLHCFRFESGAIPAFGRPVEQGNNELRNSELVIAVLGHGYGSPARPYSAETGTLEELRLAEALIQAGKLDNLFLYYRSTLESSAPVETLRSVIEPIIASKKQTLWPYKTTADLEKSVARHVSQWLEEWHRLPAICRHAFESSDLAAESQTPLGENRLEMLRSVVDIDAEASAHMELGRHCIRAYQTHGPDAAGAPLPEAAPSTSLSKRSNGKSYIAHPEYFFYLCAVGLCEAIRNDDVAAVRRRPYLNPVHQYLKALIAAEGLKAYTPTLRSWLQRRDGREAASAIARNFAAYVLGMVGDQDAEDVLADALENDAGQDVKTYCITSLGKLRSRRHMPLLRRQYERSRDPAEQILIAKALCRVIGVASFEL